MSRKQNPLLKLVNIFAFLLPAFSWAALAPPTSLDPVAALLKFKAAVESLDSYSVLHFQEERFGKELGPKFKMRVKFSQGRVYVRMLEGPKKDAEVIFVPGKNNGDVKVHQGSFPDWTFSLDPHGSKMMKDQHHPLEHLSFQFIGNALAAGAERCKDLPGAGAKFVKDPDPMAHQDRLTIEITAPWKLRAEKVGKDEDIWAFAKRVQADPYLIVHTNKLDGLNDLSEGKVLEVPLCYAPRTLLSLNSKTFFPERLEVFGPEGDRYEFYEWRELDSKAILTELDFDTENKQYNF